MFYKVTLLSFIIALLPSFQVLAEDSFTSYKPIIQKSFSNQNNNIIQKNLSTTLGNDFVSENAEPLENYTLGIGDIIQVSLIHKDLDFDYTLSINPEGKIFIPKIGEFLAFNQTIPELKSKIAKKMALKIKDFELSVFLTKVRSIKVFLTGYVNNPGSYVLPYSSRLSDVLKLGGGTNENGSLRNIEVYSTKNQKKTIDLYNFVYKGNLEENPKLQAGDKIFIPYISKRIAILGNTLKPGIYEFKEKDSYHEMLKLAGAFSTGNALNKVLLWKKGMNSYNNDILELDLNSTISLEDGDILFLQENKVINYDYQVHIYGQVPRQGSFQYKEGLKISDYIKLAGGTNNTADLEKVKITRTYNKNGTKQTEIIIVDLNNILYNGKIDKDLELKPNDVILISERFFNFRNFSDITNLTLSTLGIVSLVMSFIKK